MADKRISQLIERVDIANNDVLPIVASGATTTNKVTISTIQEWMQDNLDVGVTSVGITIGSTGTDINVTGSPVTSSGNITINIPTASATNRGLLSSANWTTFNNKLSSVGLTMPSAFTVSNSPLTANGTIAVTGAGTVAQYIRGDGSLADFPEAGGGGASVSYYLNGSVSQGTIGGIAYLEMNKTPILGAGTDFTINANGYIASFITDAGDPNLLLIPGGNWNLETYFQASSGGGSPSFYVELYKVDSGGTATLIASNSANPELIAFGTTTTAYFSALAVPTTVLTLTDRLALRYYVTHSGRTITMHTEDSNLCQVITTFTTGLTALNGLTAQVQNFATGTSGTDFNISSTSATHTFNLPDASASNRGAVTTGTQTFAGIKTFNSTITAGAEVQLVQAGTALPTFIKNISGSGLTSSGSNGIGFNNSNNLYLSGSDKGGAVFSINNTGVRAYTFQDNNGTLAFTSDLGGYLPLTGGTLTGALGGTSATFSGDVQSNTRLAATNGTHSIIITPNVGSTNRIEAIGSLPLALVSAHPSITMAAGGTTPQFTLGSSGLVTLTGALNGTSAAMSGLVTGGTGLRATGGTDAGSQLSLFANGSGNTFIAGFDINFNTGSNNARTTCLTLASTGAATFSSSVTTGASVNSGDSVTLLGELYWGGTTSGQKARAYTTGASGSATLNYSFWNGSTWQIVSSLSSTGAATFSSSVTATANASGRSGLFGGSSFGLRIDNAGSFNNGGTTLHGVDNTFVASYQKLSLNGSSLEFMTDYNPRVTITNGGNVGIGTASPGTYDSAKIGTSHRFLNVQSSSSAYAVATLAGNQSSADSRIGYLTFVNDNNSSSYKYSAWLGSEVEGSTANQQGGRLIFSTSADASSAGPIERMRITSGGAVQVGIAAAGTNVNFNINGVANKAGRIQFMESGSPIWLVGNGAASENGRFEIYDNINGTGVQLLRGATSWTSLSDERFKDIIEPISVLDKLKNVRAVVGKYKTDDEGIRRNFVIAQDLLDVFPEVVDVDEDEDKPMGVRYTDLIPVLIASIQEQQEQIKSLTEQVEALKSQING